MIVGAIIAAVDIRGRDRLARLLVCLPLALVCSRLGAQAPVSNAAFDDLRAELSSRAAAAGATVMSIDCRQNLRERVCVADVTGTTGRDVMTASRPLAGRLSRDPSLGLDARPLFAQRTPILDVAPAPDGKRLIVLQPSGVAIRQWTPSGDVSDVLDSRPLQTTRAWPRDLRGRLVAGRLPFDVFMPGVACRGDLDPLRLSCVDESAPWPGLANAGVEAARNYFTTPEGRPFVNAAAVADAGVRWLVADPHGALALLDERRALVAKLPSNGDDVASVTSPCAPGSFVVVSNRADDAGEADDLRLFRVVNRELVAAGRALNMPGTITALWNSIAVVHDGASDRYEAFQISVSCAR
ncbi:MAG TPA: hypothetical protein VEU08_20640 [Vicinamibacterales bacterium]|nr:hypothetical protein [Vicinamibacterales bacterium]